MHRRDTARSIFALAAAAAMAAAMLAAAPAAQFPGGFGGVRERQSVVAMFDKDGDKRLNAAERQAALAYLESQGSGRRGFGFGRRGAAAGDAAAPAAGPKVARASVKVYPASVPLYDLGALRTLFFDFEDANWERELMAFKDTDVEVPATLSVDGRTYRSVGIRFRGASSFMMVPAGEKHSINVSVDYGDKAQTIAGYKTLNLLNAHEDPSFLRAVLFLRAARDYVPAAAANLVRVVINGESWGIYDNVEQVNKAFITRWFKTDGGARWKVPGSPGARGGLEYSGDEVSAYKRVFEIKTKDTPKSWAALIHLTKVLNETPPDRLAAALAPILDVDEALKFLALDNTLVNNDGYWTRASDYNIYQDPAGVFHVFPHDINETFSTGGGPGPGGFGPPRGGFGPPPGNGGPPPGGPGFGRGRPGGFMMEGDATLDPLIGLDDATKPLRSKLLAVPELRARYLADCKAIAAKWLDWRTLEPIVTPAHALIAADVKADTHKLYSEDGFETSLAELKTFADTRRAFIASYQAK